MTIQQDTIKLGIYEFFKILFNSKTPMNINDIFNIIESYDFAKKYQLYKTAHHMKSNLKNHCIGYEMTKCKKLGFLKNIAKGYWEITNSGEKLFQQSLNYDDFFNKYKFLWNYFYKTHNVIDVGYVLNNDFIEHESEIEFIHRTRIVEEYQRDPKIKQKVLENNNYQCFFNNNHITFQTSNGKNYMEGHHIIPVSRNKSFSQNLDVVENVLCLCPNCHRKIHLATNEIKRPMLEEIIDRTKVAIHFNINLMQLKEIYLSNIQ